MSAVLIWWTLTLGAAAVAAKTPLHQCICMGSALYLTRRGLVVNPSRASWAIEDWRLLAESIPHIVWVADDKGRTVFFNDRGSAYTGASAWPVDWTAVGAPRRPGWWGGDMGRGAADPHQV